MQCCTWRRPRARVAATLPARIVGERVDIYLRPQTYVQRIVAAPDFFFVYLMVCHARAHRASSLGLATYNMTHFTEVGNELLHMAGE